MAAKKRSNRTWTVEEERPVFKSERRTDALAIAHNISLLVRLERIKDDSQNKKAHHFIVEISTALEDLVSHWLEIMGDGLIEGFKWIIL